MSIGEGTLTAVILAAGQGQRLRGETRDGLKPLTPLLGLTLLERAVRSCQMAGVMECYIVTGYGQERLTPYIADLARRYSLRLHAVENPHWQEGNGTSALSAEPYVHGSFLLLMCDHVFDPAILRHLVAAAHDTGDCLLAVDRRIDHIFDLEDATKVQLTDRGIVAIGKGLTSFNAIDTGLFFCRPLLFNALEQARAAGDGSLTGGMRRLIERRQLWAVDIGTCFWVDVDTPESLVYAERALVANFSCELH